MKFDSLQFYEKAVRPFRYSFRLCSVLTMTSVHFFACISNDLLNICCNKNVLRRSGTKHFQYIFFSVFASQSH